MMEDAAEPAVRRLVSADLLRGAVAFVTGGGSGVNLGIARSLAAVGADVALCGRTAERLEAAAEEVAALGARVSTSVADVRDPDALARAVAATRDRLGPISVLVCGAAGNFPCLAEELSPNGFKAVVDIDLLGSFNACRAALPQLQETRGSILFVTAGQGLVPYAAQAHVGAAKAGVDHLMRVLALEWGRFGIRCNSVVPGPVDGTEGMRRLVPDDGTLRSRLEGAIPLGRFGTVDDVGAAAVFLASPLASFITGAMLVVDGGQNLPGSGAFTALVAEAMAKGGATTP
jgi:NAD(P)-dependent dehydrogenase (short-subunit alcohol dehydrogenase family)